MFSKIKNNLPILNFCVAFSGLLFQTSVLYPWHNKLDDKFKKLENIVQNNLKK